MELKWERIRIAGWQGDFYMRECLLLEEASTGMERCPGIGAAMIEAKSYYRDDRVDNPSCPVVDWDPIQSLQGDAFCCQEILDEKACARMIELAEAHQNNGAWATQRHYSVPTTDIPIDQIPQLLEWFKTQLEERIFPVQTI
jgi:hypothetical protein